MFIFRELKNYIGREFWKTKQIFHIIYILFTYYDNSL